MISVLTDYATAHLKLTKIKKNQVFYKFIALDLPGKHFTPKTGKTE